MNFKTTEFEAAFGTLAQLPRSDLPEIAFAGRSNVGKSSLLNRLCSRKALARVSSVPGKTVTVNFYRTGNVRLVDLPGYGYAKVPKSEKKRWAQLLEGYFRTNRDIRLVVQLVDMRHEPTADDETMLAFLSETGLPFAVVLTKCDKLNKTEYAERLSAFRARFSELSPELLIPFSAVRGDGAEALSAVIENSVKP